MIINIDFDGTCVPHEPKTKASIGAEIVLKALADAGHQLILFTMRSDTQEGPYADLYGLQEAVDWFKNHNIPLYGIQTNPTQKDWTESPKSYADYIIDDSALGFPLLEVPSFSDKPFVDWWKVVKLLNKEELLSKEVVLDLLYKLEPLQNDFVVASIQYLSNQYVKITFDEGTYFIKVPKVLDVNTVFEVLIFLFRTDKESCVGAITKKFSFLDECKERISIIDESEYRKAIRVYKNIQKQILKINQ